MNNEIVEKVTDQQTADAVQRRNRIQMIGIMMVGFVTLGASYLVFYFAQGSGGWGTTNNGEFVQPPLSTQQLGWQVDGGDTRNWWLWMLADDCDAACQGTVKNMRALHILLNREADRVRRGFTGAAAGDWIEAYPKMARISVADRASLKQGVYIIDPNGNLVFFYPLDTEPKPVLEDLKKLLKVSRIG